MELLVNGNIKLVFTQGGMKRVREPPLDKRAPAVQWNDQSPIQDNQNSFFVFIRGGKQRKNYNQG
ncbi:hypothetical protein [Peribacillus sp. FSL E2-0218]|uniref:hypothetical protein n=1 Tax=Peribacillus sp. FSL E2-0218 TaxID=2921364 RepID=UPI0030EC8EC2